MSSCGRYRQHEAPPISPREIEAWTKVFSKGFSLWGRMNVVWRESFDAPRNLSVLSGKLTARSCSGLRKALRRISKVLKNTMILVLKNTEMPFEAGELCCSSQSYCVVGQVDCKILRRIEDGFAPNVLRKTLKGKDSSARFKRLVWGTVSRCRSSNCIGCSNIKCCLESNLSCSCSLPKGGRKWLTVINPHIICLWLVGGLWHDSVQAVCLHLMSWMSLALKMLWSQCWKALCCLRGQAQSCFTWEFK